MWAIKVAIINAEIINRTRVAGYVLFCHVATFIPESQKKAIYSLNKCNG